MRAEGSDRVPPEGPLIVAPTHESLLDPLVVGAFLPRTLYYLARSTLFHRENGSRSGFKTWLGRVYYVVELDREGGGREAVRRALELLAEGHAVLIFPEGTRSPDGSVRDFEPGVGLLALRSGAPVLPVSIDGTRLVWPRGRKLPRITLGARVRLRYGEPTQYARPAKAEDVAADLRRRVLSLRAQGQRGAERRQGPARDGSGPHETAGGGSSA